MTNDNGKGLNWKLIKQDYCDGATWDELQSKHSVSRGALSDHYNKEQWEDEKIAYQHAIALKAKDKAIDAKVHSMGKFNSLCEEGADQANRLVRNAIIRMAKKVDSGEDLNMKKLTDLLRVQREALDIKRLINDIPLPKQRIEDVTDTKAPADEFEERVKEQLQKIQQGVDDE